MRRQVWLIVGGFMSILYGIALLGGLTMISYGGFWQMSFSVRATAVSVVGAIVLGGVVLIALGCYRLACEQPTAS